jgi:hypothetical protein
MTPTIHTLLAEIRAILSRPVTPSACNDVRRMLWKDE